MTRPACFSAPFFALSAEKGAKNAVAAVFVALALGACGSSGGTTAASTTTTSAAAVTTTTTAPTTTTAAVVATEPKPSPEAAAQRLIEGWAAGDRGAATRVSTTAAPVDAIFARPYQPPAPSSRGCGPDAPVGGNEVFDCVYEYGGGLLRITVAGHSRPGFLVTGARFEG